MSLPYVLYIWFYLSMVSYLCNKSRFFVFDDPQVSYQYMQQEIKKVLFVIITYANKQICSLSWYVPHMVEEGRLKFLHVVSYLLHLEPGCV